MTPVAEGPPAPEASAGPAASAPDGHEAPADAEVRERACHDLDTTYLIEAGAGTGKTRLLVDRYIACILEGGSDVRRVAAITFTEKAAGELRQRVRGRLLEVGEESGRSPEARARARRAIEDLEQAPISTIHAFAARLLRERPVDAGLDPAFEQLDALGASLLFEEQWQTWLDALGDEPSADDGPETTGALLARALAAGITLERLAAVARGGHTLRYLVESWPEVPPAPRLPDLAHIVGRATALSEFCEGGCADAEDRGYVNATAMCELLRGLDAAADVHEQAAVLAAAVARLSPSRDPGGRQANWGGQKPRMVELYRELAAAAEAALAEYGRRVAALVLALAGRFTAAAVREQATRGQVDFDDLLGKLRDALREKPLRACYQAEFDHILVDEFQDTDQLQVESLLFLAEDGAHADGWRDVRLRPGKLFLVGDPKQSIYRFRRADIGVYDEVKRLLVEGQGRVESISVNFRSEPSLIAWVNAVFETVIGDDASPGRQPPYTPLDAYRKTAGEEPQVHVVCGPAVEGRDSASARRAREAPELARLVSADIIGRWRVWDREAGTLRPARHADIAVLLRSFTGIDAFERALADADIPFRTEGGSAFYQRREVRDALTVLRAVDDATDAPALYGALQGTFFGFTDERLFLFSAAGGVFDYLADQVQADPEIADALTTLRDVRRRLPELGIEGALAELMRRCFVAEAWSALGEGGMRAVANLRKLKDKARAFDGRPGATLRAFLAYADQAATAGAEAESLPGDEEPAVRLMTVHAAKGLEFPIVVLADGCAQGVGERAPAQLMLDRSGGRLEARLKVWTSGTAEGVVPVETTVESAGYAAARAAEDEMDESERRRIFYVAATRAKDHLVIMRFATAAKSSLLAPLEESLPQPGAVTERRLSAGTILRPAGGPPPSAAETDAPADASAALRAREKWLRTREELLAGAVRPAAVTSPSRLEEVSPVGGEDGGEVPVARSRALAVGGAVHRVLELAPFDDEEALSALAAACAVEQGVPALEPRILALAQACWRSAPVRAAAQAPHWRELPVCLHVDGILVEGFVDLLYEGADGLVVVDYKTDAATDEDELRRRYRLQGGAYALAVEAATGRAVAAVAFVRAAHPGQGGGASVIRVSADDELRAETRAALVRAAWDGRALDERD